MISVIFKMKTGFRNSPNELIPINSEYNLCESDCAFGSLSKTNIFIGENNSGKSRLLRWLFLYDFYAINDEDIDKLIDKLNLNKSVEGKNGISKFNMLYKEFAGVRSYYSNVGNGFFSALETYAYSLGVGNKFYFPTIRGVKDYKSILDIKLRDFLDSARSIQNKDSINHYISLLNLEKNGLESFDIYREITMHEYFGLFAGKKPTKDETYLPCAICPFTNFCAVPVFPPTR